MGVFERKRSKDERSREEEKMVLSATAEKRVQSDLEEMTNHPIEGVAVVPSDKDMGVWQIFMEGPKDSTFEGGVFELEMKFPEDYPDNPPTLYFLSEFGTLTSILTEKFVCPVC